MHHTVVENYDSSDAVKVTDNDNINVSNNTCAVPRVSATKEVTNVEKNTIDTIKESRSRFSKRDQLQFDIVRSFQHVSASPLENDLTQLANNTGVKNRTIAKRDFDVCADESGPR